MKINLFKSKGSPAQQSACEFIVDSTGRNGLTFGLTWRSLVSRTAEEDAIKLARDAKASHYLFLNRQVGFVRLSTDLLKASDPPKLSAAAQVVGRHFGGNAVFAIQLDSDEFWFATVRNGAPTSLDEICKRMTLPVASEKAARLCEGLAADEVDFVIYSDISGVSGARHLSLPEIFRLPEAGVLRTIPKQTASIPKPVLYTLAAIALVLAGQQAFKHGGKFVDRLRPKVKVLQPVEDPKGAWNAAFASWLKEQIGANQDGLRAAHAQLLMIPVELNGWRLQTASCKAQALRDGQRARSWACAAAYTRLPGASLTRDLMPQAPKTWAISLTPLNGLAASWSYQQDALPALDLDALVPVRAHQIDTASELQGIAPALAQEPALVFSDIAITSPKSSDGKPFGIEHAPPEVQNLKTASIVLKGPLRSIDYAMQKSAIPADWNALSIGIVPGSDASIKQSRVVAEITGVLYAKN